MAITSVSSANMTPAKKIALVGASGAAIGAGTAYLIQKSALNKAKQQVEATGFKKVINAISSVPKKIVNKLIKMYFNYRQNMDEIVKSGKISKKGIAKTSLATALTFTALYLLKRAMHSNKKDS